MGPEEIRQLIAVLSRMTPQQTPGLPGTGQNPNLMASYLSTLAGVSPSTISSSFNPEVLFASGLFDPSQVQSAVSDIYRRQVGGFNQELAPYLASVQAPPTPEQFFSYALNPVYQTDPVIADILLSPNTGIFAKLASGSISAQKAKDDIASAVSGGQIPLNSTQLDIIESEIDTYERELPQFRRKVAEAQTTGAAKSAENQAMVNALMTNAPTERGAYAEFVKSIGLPQLAMFPAPYEEYQFQPEPFVNPDVYSRATKYKGAAERTISELAPAAEKRAGYISGVQQANVARARGAAATGAAVKAQNAVLSDAEKKYKYYQTDAGKKEFSTRFGDRFGKEFGGKPSASAIRNWYNSEKEKAKVVFRNVLASEKAKAGETITAPTVTPEMLSPKLAGARRALGGVQKMTELEYGRAAGEAQALTNALTAAGITPFQQAMIQFYGIPAATKKKK